MNEAAGPPANVHQIQQRRTGFPEMRRGSLAGLFSRSITGVACTVVQHCKDVTVEQRYRQPQLFFSFFFFEVLIPEQSRWQYLCPLLCSLVQVSDVITCVTLAVFVPSNESSSVSTVTCSI